MNPHANPEGPESAEEIADVSNRIPSVSNEGQRIEATDGGKLPFSACATDITPAESSTDPTES